MKFRNPLLLFVSISLVFLSSCWSSDESKSSRDRDTPTKEPSKVTDNRESNSGNRSNENTANKMTGDIKSGGFKSNLPDGFKAPSDDVGQRLLREYGALFVAKGGARPPDTVVFKNEAEVSAFQDGVQTARANVGSLSLELQAVAMTALNEAITDAGRSGLTITPRGADSARRRYGETVTLWASRVDPGLKHWVGKGRLSESEANRIRSLSPYEQVPEIFKLEAQGMYFAKDLSKSIIYSVAPPGTSQHLSMLAFDVTEHENARVRATLANHGWFQTVSSDLPHFTYLGVKEADLPGLGLKSVTNSGRAFWVPDI